jgi:hypothetical protein
VFDLEPRASDARQLAHFYLYLNRILAEAGTKCSIVSPSTVPLQVTDFASTSKEQRRSSRHLMARSAA